MIDLAGRTCLITGASSGLGAHFGRLLAMAGGRVVLAARRRERIEQLGAELRSAGCDALAVEMDVTDENSVKAAFDGAEAAFGTVDTVIANAGRSAPGRSTEVSVDALRGLLETNVLGVILTAREAARRLIAAGSRETGKGRIVLVGSMGADISLPGETIYCASKAAVARMGRDLAREWIRQGINVNVIQPGFIMTGMTEDWFASEGGKAQIAGFQRRRLQSIDSIDELVLLLCSDAASAITGAVMTVDDGQSL